MKKLRTMYDSLLVDLGKHQACTQKFV